MALEAHRKVLGSHTKTVIAYFYTSQHRAGTYREGTPVFAIKFDQTFVVGKVDEPPPPFTPRGSLAAAILSLKIETNINNYIT